MSGTALAALNRALSRHLARSRHPLRRHIEAVARLAAFLARKHGADPVRAAAAGYLHDWVKPCSRARLWAMLRRNRVRVDSETKRAPALWHGPAAAACARSVFDVSDRGVLDAVRWHTTGRPGASRLLRVVFVADFCAPDRDYPEAAVGWRLAKRSLDLATRYVLASKLVYLNQKGRRTHPAALAFWRQLLDR